MADPLEQGQLLLSYLRYLILVILSFKWLDSNGNQIMNIIFHFSDVISPKPP